MGESHDAVANGHAEIRPGLLRPVLLVRPFHGLHQLYELYLLPNPGGSRQNRIPITIPPPNMIRKTPHNLPSSGVDYFRFGTLTAVRQRKTSGHGKSPRNRVQTPKTGIETQV